MKVWKVALSLTVLAAIAAPFLADWILASLEGPYGPPAHHKARPGGAARFPDVPPCA
jgi:hypothetical protein